MDYTQNLHLPQWEASDRIHHDDFNDAFEKLDTLPRIVTGSYTGDGQYGSSHPNTLTFPFAPKLLLVQNENGTYYLLALQGNTVVLSRGGDTHSEVVLAWNENTVSWYASYGYENIDYQLNKSGITYRYLAIG